MNTLAPLGFADSHRLGAAPNYQLSRRWISPSNPTPIFQGDPIVQLSTGFIAQATPGATQVGGIFLGCEWMSIGQRKMTGRNMWPGTDAVAGLNVQARIIDDPLTVFRAQANGQLTLAMIDVVTTPPAATATFPFRIIDLITDPPGANGTDQTSPYSMALVTFNNQDFKSLTGI
jgi:hypothetical protein